jgi:hypothetical protein
MRGMNALGMSKTPTYSAWRDAIRRCHDPRDCNYKRYGARGIVVCERWRTSFPAFFADMGIRPDGMSIDRIDNDGPYSPENCRWATRKVQSRNRRNTVFLTAFGETKPLADWADDSRCVVTQEALRDRCQEGWDTEAALTTLSATQAKTIVDKAISDADSEALLRTLSGRYVEDGDCLRWIAACCNGHPSMRVNGKSTLVRRVLWERKHGAIPAGHIVRCTCETPRCINVDHCEVTTYRKLGKQLGALGVMSGWVRSAKIAAVKRASQQARISQEDARAIRNSDEKLSVLAARYGISESTASRIKLGRVRREFDGNVWQGLTLFSPSPAKESEKV